MMYRRGNPHRHPLPPADFSIWLRSERKQNAFFPLVHLAVQSGLRGRGAAIFLCCSSYCNLLQNCKNRPQGLLGGGDSGGDGCGDGGGNSDGHASPSSSFSEIEFGRAGPTSPRHSTIHLVIPSRGEEAGGRDQSGRGKVGTDGSG